MDRRTFSRRFSQLSALVALPLALQLVGCEGEAKKQAELAKADLAEAEGIVKAKHVAPLAEALPKAADAIANAKDRAAAFVALRDKTDALRSSKRSFYAFTDAKGAITWVEDPDWQVVDRKLKVGFPAVAEVLDGAKPYATSAGRFGDEGPEALWFVAAAPLKANGVGPVDGALVAAWDAHEVAGDLQRQLATAAKMQIAAPKKRVKDSDRLQLALDTPQIWVAVYAPDGSVFLPWGAPQTLEDAMKGVGFGGKDVAGWTGIVKVTNASWGVASKRIDALLPGYGLAVIRNK
jgi:hypothetical protein